MSRLDELLKEADEVLSHKVGKKRTLGDYLEQYFGYKEFKPAQEEIINNILDGNSTIAVLATGAGKSICYELPGLLFDGVTVVVSPIIALMKDQVDALIKKGIHKSSFINSSLSPAKQRLEIEKLDKGGIKILYIAPERFRSHFFIHRLERIRVSLFVIDEVHCVSFWGHDFRPDYLALNEVVDTIKPKRLAFFTATATSEVIEDVKSRFKLQNPIVIRGNVTRENLVFINIIANNEEEKLLRIKEIVNEINGSGIIYAGTRRETEFIANLLKALGREADYYHAGRRASDRKSVQERFFNDEIEIMSATCAFGMGIDKKDIRFVIHYAMPGSLEEYYQEAGRAGRDGKKAYCILLYARDDKKLQEFFIENGIPTKKDLGRLLKEIENCKGVNEYKLINREDLGYKTGLDEVKLRVGISFLENLGFVKRYFDVPIHFYTKGEINGRIDTINYCKDRGGISPQKFMSEILDLELEGRLKYTVSQWGILLELREKSALLDELPDVRFGFESYKLEKYRKLDKIVHYALSGECRKRLIEHYFGTRPVSGCGACDNCIPELKTRWVRLKRDEDIRAFLEKESKPELKGNFAKGFALGFHTSIVEGKRMYTEIGEAVYKYKYCYDKSRLSYLLDKAEAFLNEGIFPVEEIDLIVPIPSTLKRSTYNPVLLFVSELSKRINKRKAVDALVKVRSNLPQKDMETLVRKRRNVRGVFALRDKNLIQDKIVLLVDDLYDSGCTINEAEKILKNSGAKKVFVFTLTKTSHVNA